MINGNSFRRGIYTIFSDQVMVALSVAAIIVFILEYSNLPTTILIALWIMSGVIWFAFVLEFVFRAFVEGGIITYIMNHKLDAFLSLIIIFTPIFSVIINYFFLNITSFGVLRLGNVLKPSIIVRGAAYALKAGIKSSKK